MIRDVPGEIVVALLVGLATAVLLASGRDIRRWIGRRSREARGLWIVSRRSRTAREMADGAERDALLQSPRAANWWRNNLSKLRKTVILLATPRPRLLARGSWFNLASATATWHSGQAGLDELEDWEAICASVQEAAPERMEKERAWVHNELAAITRLRGPRQGIGSLPVPREPHSAVLEAMLKHHELARGSRGHHGRGQVATNGVVIQVHRAAEADLPGREGLLAGTDPLPYRLHHRNDVVGLGLADLGFGVAALMRVETAAARHRAAVDHARRNGTIAPDDSDVIDEIRAHLETAEKRLKKARENFTNSNQLRAEMATIANLILLEQSTRHWAPAMDPGLLAAQSLVQAADAIHSDLTNHLGRNDRLTRAALLLNLGAALVWSGAGDDTDATLEKNLRKADERLRQSRALWGELVEQVHSLEGQVRTPRYLLRGEGRCLLYLGDAGWRRAGLQGAGWETHFTAAQASWSRALSFCREASDQVGVAAALRRPGDRA